MTFGFWPTEAQRQAAIFENAYAELVYALAKIGKIPPSRDVVVEEARRRLDRTPFQVVQEKRVRLST